MRSRGESTLLENRCETEDLAKKEKRTTEGNRHGAPAARETSEPETVHGSAQRALPTVSVHVSTLRAEGSQVHTRGSGTSFVY